MEKNLYTERHAGLLALLRTARKEANLKQEELANLLNKPQSFISKYESGERRLDILELFDVCQAIGIPFSEFTKRLEKYLTGKSTT